MPSQDPRLEFPLKSRRIGKSLQSLAIILLASVLHFLLQLQLGSFIAGQPITNLPETTQVSLGILVFIFLSVLSSLFVQSRRLAQNLLERSLVWFLIATLLSILAVLTFRMPYSSVFLFLGTTLQVPLWILTALTFEKLNKPIIGVTKQSLPNFKNLISQDFVRTISPATDKFAELDLIVLKESELASKEWADFLMKCFAHSIAVEEYINFMERLNGKVDLDHLSFRESQQLLRKNGYMPIKRLIDITFSVLLLIFLMPFMTLVAILIRLESPGRVIFLQERAGLGGGAFTIYKFRTMRNVSDGSKASFTDEHDARVTRIGKVLRKFRIDELPQLWNVMIGEMSLIGPRPEQLDLIGSIQNEIPLFSLRHSLRPGITGWAQVRHGYAGDISTIRTKLSYDLWYVSNVSIIVDISIAIRTVRVIFTGFGSR